MHGQQNIKYYWGDKILKKEMGRAFSTHGEKRNAQ